MTKIFLVEDETVLGKLYKKHLETIADQVILLQKVEEVKNLSHDQDPSLFILDLDLGDNKTSGLDLITDLKAKFPQAKVIILSNFSSPELKKATPTAGAEEFYVKLNMPPKELAQRVKGLIG